LNGGDSWTRKRASESLTKNGGSSRETGGEDMGGMEIKEEDEAQESHSFSLQPNEPTTEPEKNHETSGQNIGPPPGLDLASVEWSYLDTQGQIQGVKHIFPYKPIR
jgi:hypothetical protein